MMPLSWRIQESVERNLLQRSETTLRSRKFIPRFIGPYAILAIQGNVVLLDLPANLKHLSLCFNIDKLKVYTSNPDRFEGRVIPKSTPVIFDDDGAPLHVVEALIKKRIFNRQPEYLVKWHGLPHHENTWERERDVKHVKSLASTAQGSSSSRSSGTGLVEFSSLEVSWYRDSLKSGGGGGGGK
ncbi:hypothetical protein PC112_g13230 [Phytophthora cactorum]|nr:hypothetical protein PC112_g13230 [Phytophthora cactorum]